MFPSVECQREGRGQVPSAFLVFTGNPVGFHLSPTHHSAVTSSATAITHHLTIAPNTWRHEGSALMPKNDSYSAAALLISHGGSRRPPLIQWLSLSR
jgi:hypothetical protein